MGKQAAARANSECRSSTTAEERLVRAMRAPLGCGDGGQVGRGESSLPGDAAHGRQVGSGKERDDDGSVHVSSWGAQGVTRDVRSVVESVGA